MIRKIILYAASIMDAGKDNNVENIKIYEVATGKRKSTYGFRYKFCDCVA